MIMLAPSMFIGHGAPLNAIWDTKYRDNIAKYSKEIDIPEAILVVSAHWEKQRPLEITSAEVPGIIYDYYGFPEEMYQLKYSAPGNPQLAKKIADQLTNIGFTTELNPNQGLDHGTWIPLKMMFPEAQIPVLQLSIPIPRMPNELYKIGQTLRNLREINIMLMGSGNLVHNLPYAFKQMQTGNISMANWSSARTDSWAREADAWIKEQLDAHNTDELLDAPSKLPNFRFAAPTTEHFDPLYFFLGTLQNEGISYIHEGFEAGSISMRSFTGEN